MHAGVARRAVRRRCHGADQAGVDSESSNDDDDCVLFKLIYDAPSRAPEGKIAVDVFPGKCTLKK